MTASFTPLHPGARVAIVAPSGPATPSLLRQSAELVRSWGLEPVLGPHVGAGHPRASYLSAPDADRAADLQWAWTDPEIAAVFCARGGYGSIRMLDLLDVDALRAARPKPIFGSSDATGIAEFWLERLDAGFWFAPMLATAPMVDDPVAMADLHRAVFEPVVGREFTSAEAATLVPGTATGRLVGGNLSLLALTLGARGRPPLDNRASPAAQARPK
jgi:muramoyltetrapeptide carboxypeptidase